MANKVLKPVTHYYQWAPSQYNLLPHSTNQHDSSGVQRYRNHFLTGVCSNEAHVVALHSRLQ